MRTKLSMLLISVLLIAFAAGCAPYWEIFPVYDAPGTEVRTWVHPNIHIVVLLHGAKPVSYQHSDGWLEFTIEPGAANYTIIGFSTGPAITRR